MDSITKAEAVKEIREWHEKSHSRSAFDGAVRTILDRIEPPSTLKECPQCKRYAEIASDYIKAFEKISFAKQKEG